MHAESENGKVQMKNYMNSLVVGVAIRCNYEIDFVLKINFIKKSVVREGLNIICILCIVQSRRY